MRKIAATKLGQFVVLILSIATISVQNVIAKGGDKSAVAGEIEEKPFGSRESTLPANVEPINYKVELTYDFELVELKGKVEMVLKFGEMESISVAKKMANRIQSIREDSFGYSGRPRVVERESRRDSPSDYIALNIGHHFTIKKVWLVEAKTVDKLDTGKRIDVTTVWRTGFVPVAVLDLKRDLTANSYGKLSIEYERKKDSAFEHSKVDYFLKLNMAKIKTGSKKSSQVSYYSTNPLLTGKDLFPCIDDPKQRATISLVIKHNIAGQQVVSNMPASKPTFQDESKFYTTEFEQTSEPTPMHKLAFAIGAFDEPLVGQSSKGVTVRLITKPGQSEQARFALEFAKKSLDWLEKYTGVGAQFKTISIVGSPSVGEWSISGGPGISLVSHGSLLADEQEVSAEQKTLVSMNVALAMARQWFGCLKTESVSTELWIPEGLAAHLAIRLVRELAPELASDSYVQTKMLKRALAADVEFGEYLQTTVKYGKDIHGPKFSLIRLMKGASIMQILERNVVDDKAKFDDIVRSLLQESGVTISHSELVQAFANSKFDQDQIEEILNRWSTQFPYPMIKLSLNEQGKLDIEQLLQDGATDYYWPLALEVKFSSKDGTKTDFKQVDLFDFGLDKMKIELDLPSWFESGKGSTDWVEVVANDETQLQYFGVAYSDELWARSPKAAIK